jgi:hypothetical protein
MGWGDPKLESVWFWDEGMEPSPEENIRLRCGFTPSPGNEGMGASPMVPITRAVGIRDGQVGLHGLGWQGDGRQDGAGWGGAGQGGGCREARRPNPRRRMRGANSSGAAAHKDGRKKLRGGKRGDVRMSVPRR